LEKGAGGIVDSWISYDFSNSKVTIDTDNVTLTAITYEFVLKTQFGRYSAQKVLSVAFFTWSILNCNRWDTPTVWAACHSGFEWNAADHKCEENASSNAVSPQIKSAQTIGQSVVASGITLGWVSAILTSSSSQGAWSTVNQFQLYLLLPILGAFIHKDVLDFLQGFDFSMVSLSFIKLDSVPVIGYLLSLFSYGANGAYVQSIGLEYESTIRNIMGLIISFLGIIVLHVAIIIPLHIYASKFDEKAKLTKLSKILFLFFTFTVYIRIILESYLIIWLSWILEIWKLGPNEAIAVFAFVIGFTISFFVIWRHVH
jgi:hypothetical protein